MTSPQDNYGADEAAITNDDGDNDDVWEVTRESVAFTSKIGDGSFGVVWKGRTFDYVAALDLNFCKNKLKLF